MKRYGNFYSKIYEWNNLLLAFYKASKTKRQTGAIQNYEKHLYANLRKLQLQIVNQKIDLGHYRFFKIYDPKERTICAAPFRDRILHHAIMNVCEPVFESFQIDDSYACRKGKGTQRALYRAFDFSHRFPYCIKLDMKKYFDSIPHQNLLNLLERRFKDPELLALFSQIIFSYQVEEGRGLPIGNLTSQYFANYYLAFFDHYAKEVLRIKGFVRYMDDILIFSQTKEQYKKILALSLDFLQNNLFLQVKEEVVCCTAQGIPFLGFLVKPYSIRFLQRKRKRIKRKLAEYEYFFNSGFWSEEEFAIHAASVLAFNRWVR